VNYTELKTNVNDICEQTFTDDQLAMFTKQAEQKIYTTVSLPALRKNQTGSLTNGNKYLTMPSGFLYAYSLAIISGSDYIYLLDKDVNFMREAYPNPATTGVPVHYAIFDETSFIVGPTPNANFDAEIHFAYYPESIVTTGTSWLGTEFDSALLNGTLVEAIRFQKGEPDMVALYDNMYAQSLALLKNLGDGKLREDTYRGGQVKVETA
jgi:hypothetical protein|tara:strand:+ start:14378 stop:15004 length:627 start_codon:yes stop_codon:yes gene_type:complete